MSVTTPFERWADPANLDPRWDARTALLASLVEPGSRVLEFGCGRRVMRGMLPAGCTYTSSDLHDRGPGTFVCDLNARPLPEFPEADTAVFGGVLEYLRDVPSLVGHLRAPTVIASYAVVETHPAPKRHANGWVNDYSASDLVGVFAAAGYAVHETRQWGKQVVFVFKRRAPR